LPVSELSPSRADDAARLAAAVKEAGAVALSFYKTPLKKWTKGEGDSPVTEADIAANDILHGHLLRPGDGWLSEESENDPTRIGARRVWVVDPIDGTRAFIAGREDWSISVALVEDGRPTVAAVFAPVTNEMFTAMVGGGATRNDQPMASSEGSDLDGAKLGGPKRILDWLTQRHPNLVAMPRIHSLALRIVRVATGELDAAIAGGSGHDWDLAAADLLVHEAGGAITGLDGKPLIYNKPEPVHGMLVAAGRKRHAVLIDWVRQAA
jgi:myo-inositol-1(or 4)-monophosphatase